MGRWAIHREAYFLILNCNFLNFIYKIRMYLTINDILELYLSVFLFLVTSKIMVYLIIELMNH